MTLKNDDDFMYIEVKPLLYVIVIAIDIHISTVAPNHLKLMIIELNP